MTELKPDYPKPSVSVDLVVLRRREGREEVLLIRRGKPPFMGEWALPGGFLDIHETLEMAAARELYEETAVEVSPEQLIQIGAFSRVDRDPRGRVISVAFRADVPAETRPQPGDDARETSWFALDSLPPLAFDHAHIIAASQKGTPNEQSSNFHEKMRKMRTLHREAT